MTGSCPRRRAPQGRCPASGGNSRRAGSEVWWAGSFGPGDAAGVKQHAEPVVVEGAEAVPAALDLLDAQVQAFGRPVRGSGVVVGEDLAAPRLERLAERADLSDLVGEATNDRFVQQRRGVRGVSARYTSRTLSLASQAPTVSSLGSPTR